MRDFHLTYENTIRMDVLMLNQFINRCVVHASLSYLTSFPPCFIPSVSYLPLPFRLLHHVSPLFTPYTPSVRCMLCVCVCVCVYVCVCVCVCARGCACQSSSSPTVLTVQCGRRLLLELRVQLLMRTMGSRCVPALK